MGFYDMLVRARPDKEFAERAISMGWDGICIVFDEDKKTDFRNSDLDISRGILLKPGKASDVPKIVKRHRKDFELVCVQGGTPDLNREIVETPEADMLVGHSPGGKIGINHVITKIARENNVMICFDFSELLSSYKKTRSWIFSAMVQAGRLVNKYKTPVCITPGAKSVWEIRSPSDMLSFSRLLGIPDKKAKSGMSGDIIKKNREHLSGRVIARGVELAGTVKSKP